VGVCICNQIELKLFNRILKVDYLKEGDQYLNIEYCLCRIKGWEWGKCYVLIFKS